MTGCGALRAAAIALFAAACVAAPLSAAGGQDISCDRGDQEVRALEFNGNRAVSDNELSRSIVTTLSSRGRRWFHLWFAEKRCLNHDELPRDVLRLKAYYRERGFYSTQVDTLVQPMGKSAVRVVFNIQEGEPTRLTSYSVTGLDGVRDSADIMRRLRLRVGQPFDFTLFRADMDSIVRRLRDAGYFRAEVLPGYDRDTSRIASALITVLPGKRARFEEPDPDVTPVDQRGQQIPDAVVKRVMGIEPGQQYSDRAIVEAQRNLFQLGTYRHIEVAPDSVQPPGDTLVRLAVRLTEDYMRQLDSEFGWATLDCGRLRLQYTDKNVLSSARRLELTAQTSKIGYGYPLSNQQTRRICTLGNSTDLRFDQFSDTMHYFVGATLRQPRLLGTKWVPAISLYSERRGEFRAYLRSTPIGADFSATRDVGERMPLRLGYSMEYGRTDAPDAAFCALFNRCDLASRQQLRRSATLGVASAALARLRTDNLLSPTRGYSMRGELRSSASRLLGTSDSLFYFNKGTGDVAWYARIDARNVLAFRLRGGAVVGRRLNLSDNLGFIPPQERLYAGGPTSVRGFQQNELGELVYILRDRPRPDTTISGTDTTFHFVPYPDSLSLDRAVPLGGNTLVVANLEYRVRDPFFGFPDLLQWLFFVDGGDVWTRGATHAFNLKWTPGLGVRALTPVGPVQINLAYNDYPREKGALFFNPDVRTLVCVSPTNTLFYRHRPSTVQGEPAVLEPTDPSAPCPPAFDPPPRTRRLQRLTFTFSIGSDF